jgi:hypothetical protein
MVRIEPDVGYADLLESQIASDFFDSFSFRQLVVARLSE